MIFILIFIDILINNFTKYSSYFFLVGLYNKTYKYYLITGIILDYIIFKTFFYNIFILSIMYILNKIFKSLNKQHIYNFIFILLFNYILYISLSNFLLEHNISNILTSIGNNLFVNSIFYILSYRLYKRNV